MLRQLAQYHAKDPNNLFMVRLAQVGSKKRWRSGTLTYVLEGGGVCVSVSPNPCSVPYPQGLTHLGKGTLTLCPYHSDRQLMSQVAVAGLLTVLVSFLDVKNSESFSSLIYLHHSFYLPLPIVSFSTSLCLGLG